MKTSQYITLLTIVSLGFAITSCNDTRQPVTTSSEDDSKKFSSIKPIIESRKKMMQDEVNIFDELGKTLETITDLESAKAAIPALTDINFKFNCYKIDMENAEHLSNEHIMKLKEKFKEKRTQVITVVIKELKRLETTQPEAYSVTLKLIEGISL